MTRRTASGTILLALFVLLFAAVIAFVVIQGSAVGLHDDAVHAAAADPSFRPGLGWLWSQHNEHRIPLPRLVFSLLLHATRDFRTATVVNVWMLALAAGGLALLARRLRGRWSLADAFFPFAFFSWGQHETFLSGFQVVFVIPVAIACALTAVFAGSSGRPSARRVALVAFLALLLPLCGAPGLVQAAMLAVWLGWVWFALRGVQGIDVPRTRAVAAFGALLTVALCAAYCAGLRVEHPNQTPDVRALVSTASQVLATWTGEAARTAWPWSGVLMTATIVAASIAGIALARRDAANRARWFGLLAIVVSSALIALAIGRGRGGDGTQAGLASRYGTLMLVWPSAIFLGAAHLADTRWSRGLQFALCALAAWGWVASVPGGTAAGASRALAVSAIERRVAQGVSYTEIADRRPELTGEARVHFVRALRDLDRAGVAPFAHPAGRDPWLLLGRDPWTRDLHAPQRVLAGGDPVEMRILDGVDAFAVAPGSALGWDLPERVTVVRGLCGVVPGVPWRTDGSQHAMVAEILDDAGHVLVSARVDVAPDSDRAVDGRFDFGMYSPPAPGRTLVLRCEAPTHGESERPGFFWAEVRIR